MRGGADPPGLVTEKVSVRHEVARLYVFPLPTVKAGWPLSSEATDVVDVEGPEITKVLKSKRS